MRNVNQDIGGTAVRGAFTHVRVEFDLKDPSPGHGIHLVLQSMHVDHSHSDDMSDEHRF